MQYYLAVEPKPEVPEYQIDHGSMPIHVFWGFLVIAAAAIIWGGGILWWVAGMKNRLEQCERKVREGEEAQIKRETALLEKIGNKLDTVVLKLSGSIEKLDDKIEHLKEDLQNAADARSQTLSGMREQLIRQGQENTELQRQFTEVRARVDTVTSILQNGPPSNPARY